MTTPSTPIAKERRQAVDAALADVRSLTARGLPDRATLASITARLEQLATQKALFSRTDFPPPAETQGVGASTRYRLNPDDGDGGLALYLNSINPGKTTAPHNHTTWAVIVAVEGQEVNRIYSTTLGPRVHGAARCTYCVPARRHSQHFRRGRGAHTALSPVWAATGNIDGPRRH